MGVGIRTKIALLALLCASLPAVLVSLIAFSSSRATLEAVVRTELSELARNQMVQLQALLQQAETDLGTWSGLHTMQDVLIDDQDGNIANELTRLQQRYPRFGDLLVVNPKGIVVAASSPHNISGNVGGEDFFAPAKNGAGFRGGLRRHDLIDASGIAMSFPIRADYDRETVVGVLIGIVDWAQIQTALRSVKIWGSTQDPDHRLVLRSKTGGHLFGETDAGAGEAPLEFPRASGVELLIGPSTSFLVGTQEDQYSGWLMHAMISDKVAYAEVIALRNHIAALSAAIILAAVILGVSVSGRSIVRPIKSVTAAMTRVSEGQVDVDLKGSERRDEIGQMLSAIAVFRSNLERDNARLSQSEKALRTQNLRFDSALNNMSQGLSMFNAKRELIVSNPQYAALYSLPHELTVPGTTLDTILKYIIDAGTCSARDVEHYSCESARRVDALNWDSLLELADGRCIAISHRQMSEGGWVSTHADITERRRSEALITHMARHDALTNLPNRVLFRAEIDKAVRHLSTDANLAVLCLDLDRFKSVNDTLGHPVGDDLLRDVAVRLREACDEDAIVARLGGDEFAIIQTRADQPAGAIALAQRVIATLKEPYHIQDHNIVIGASVGIAFAPTDGDDADTLMKNADLALYRAKLDGSGCYRLFEPEMDAKMQARRALEVDFRRALGCGEFELYYQPLANIESGKIVGFEALVRWNHPKRGVIGPGEFIPVAEETGLIIGLGEWVLKQACRDAATWPLDIRVSVNLSPVQFRSPNLVSAVFNALAVAHLSARRLDLEITETVLLHDSEATLATLYQLNEMGVRISMDEPVLARVIRR